MLLGVLSDTHGQTSTTLQALRLLESLQVDEILHCGDIGTPRIVDLFSAWPTHFVLGNVDRYQSEIPQSIRLAKQTLYQPHGELEREGIRIAWLHGDDERGLSSLIHDGGWNLVCHGHTHRRRWEKIGSTWVLNPGALERAEPLSFAVVELPSLRVEWIEI